MQNKQRISFALFLQAQMEKRPIWKEVEHIYPTKIKACASVWQTPKLAEMAGASIIYE